VTGNPAAERLLEAIYEFHEIDYDSCESNEAEQLRVIRAALLHERRATVERIRAQVRSTKFDPVSGTDAVVAFLRILDATASEEEVRP